MRHFRYSMPLCVGIVLAICVGGIHRLAAEVTERTLYWPPGSAELTPDARRIIADIVQDQKRNGSCTGVSVSFSMRNSRVEAELGQQRYTAVVAELGRDGLPLKCLDGPTVRSLAYPELLDRLTIRVGTISARQQIEPVVGPIIEMAAARISAAMKCEVPESSPINVRQFYCRSVPISGASPPDLSGVVPGAGRTNGTRCLWFSWVESIRTTEDDRTRVGDGGRALLTFMHVSDPEPYMRDFLDPNPKYMNPITTHRHPIDAVAGTNAAGVRRTIGGCFVPGEDAAPAH